ncbi:MAG: radical SAM protein [Thiohalocapsa sp.]
MPKGEFGTEGRRFSIARPRVLLVNAYFDDLRREGGRPFSAPQSIGPTYLAGAFHAVHCEVRLYNEQYSGPLDDPGLLGWPDMLVLTGLTVALDRMRQLTAYARTRNPKVIVVAGGPAVRALPRYSAQFFDYACSGDIEELREVVAEALGQRYQAAEMFPRFDLTYWFGRIAYIEASRNCNFRCGFCSLTGEGQRYRNYDLDSVRRQILALDRPQLLTFLDNNFYGNDRKQFRARIDLLRTLWHEGRFGRWTALVTHDFFLGEGNLALVREAGCMGLFSGVESFQDEHLRRFGKLQNTPRPQIELIRECLDAGVVFAYGVILDLTTRRLRDCHDELAFITGTAEIPLPAFVNQSIPLLGTPYFQECLDKGLLLPLTKLRDMDGSTLVTYPLDPMDEVAEFLRGLPQLRGYRRRVLRHTAGFLRRYGRRLSPTQLAIPLSSAAMTVAPALASSPTRLGFNGGDGRRRTYIATTEILDRRYRPVFPVDARYEDYFRPTMVTDADGCLAESLIPDLGEADVARQGVESSQRIA